MDNKIQKAIETQKSIYKALCRSMAYSNSVGTICIPVDRIEDIKTAISAMQELQRYRQIGMPEECREARRKQEPKKYKLINLVRCCPECDSPIKACYDFCKTCGQAIDWSRK